MCKNRIRIGILSILAMLAIAFSNIFFDIWNALKTSDPLWDMYGLLSVCTQWGIPLLVALMGIIYIDTDMPHSTSVVYKKYFPTAMAACIFWWVINALIYQRMNHINELDWETFLECMSNVLYQPYNVFLLQLFAMLFAFYPLLTRIARDRGLLFYAVITSFVISMLLPILEFIPYVRYISLFTSQINWNFFTSFGFYLFFGIWIMKLELQWHHRVVAYCSGILSTVAMLTLTKTVSVFDVDTRYIGFNSPFIAFQLLAIFVLIKQLFKSDLKNKAVNNLLGSFSKNLYGFIAIYVMVNETVIRYFGENKFIIPLLSFFAANLLIMVLRRLPITSFLICEFRSKGGKK